MNRGERIATIARPSGAQARKAYTVTKQREKWTAEEHARFLDALKLYGRQWRRIEGAGRSLSAAGGGRGEAGNCALGNRPKASHTPGPASAAPILFALAAPAATRSALRSPPPRSSRAPSAEHVATKTAVQIRSHAQKVRVGLSVAPPYTAWCVVLAAGAPASSPFPAPPMHRSIGACPCHPRPPSSDTPTPAHCAWRRSSSTRSARARRTWVSARGSTVPCPTAPRWPRRMACP